MLNGPVASREERGVGPVRLVHTPGVDCDVYAPASGIYEPFHGPGDDVAAGQPAGAIHFIEDPEHPPAAVHYGRSGLLFAVRAMGRVERGDGVAMVASDCCGGQEVDNGQEIAFRLREGE